MRRRFRIALRPLALRVLRAYALSGGNSLSCSREPVFDAKLARLPVIVLSNNDGFCK